MRAVRKTSAIMIARILVLANVIPIVGVIYFVSQFWILGLGLVLLLFLSESVAVTLPGIILGSFNVYPHDIVFLILAAAFLIRMFVYRRLSTSQICWTGF